MTKLRIDKWGQLRIPESEEDKKKHFIDDERWTARPAFFVLGVIILLVAALIVHFVK